MAHKSSQMMNIRYFAYQIPVGLQSPVLYEISGVEKSGFKMPLIGMCLRDPERPAIYYFWDKEGNSVVTVSIMDVKAWTESLSFVNGVKCSYIYPPKYTPE